MEYNGHRYVYAAASEGESEVLCCVYLSGFDEGGRGTGSNESKEEGRRTCFHFSIIERQTDLCVCIVSWWHLRSRNRDGVCIM